MSSNAERDDQFSTREDVNRDIDGLFLSVMDELRELAAEMLAREKHAQSIQPTALINDAYLRLVRNGQIEYNDRSHFFHVAARTLHRLLIEHARARGRIKHGGRAGAHLDVGDVEPASEHGEVGALSVEEIDSLRGALRNLSEEDDRLAQVVELKFFRGLTMEQIANVLGLSERAVYNDWRFARAKLRRVMEEIGAETGVS